MESPKSYNKEYYEKNKQRIKDMLLKKVTCDLCNRQVNHQNLPRHKQSKLCMNNRIVKAEADLLILVNNLENKIKQLEDKVNASASSA